ncbi:regulatory protein RecX [Halobacillus andaensis]|uniref:Regulatory protein RecX n=1 Tax=Halobacillus andaensis TaxID=1176239 RepID=A0A917B7L3_HALAA|nr:recombination regulator RecX [Halobacillus andaensis]MBP2006156.1 regulatory protein [Halobacillus andaensis]GGF23244.1 regulatory protein RecX [Halobacillus andaensis]
MAKITRITTQKKSKNRYNIYLDRGQGEAYGFSVDEDILIKYRLQKSMELEESTIEALIQKDTIHKVYTQTINYLSYRMRSEKEIRDYLVKKEVDEEHINEIIRRLYQEKLLDDLEFAKALVRTRITTSSKGPIMLKKELIEKGVDASLADEAVQEFPFDRQVEKAVKLAEKKLKSDRKKSQRQQIQNVQQHLMQKGFTSDVVKESLTRLPEEEEEQEWEAVVFQGEKLLRKYERKSEGYELKQKIKSGLYRKGFSFELIDRFIDENVIEK